MKPSRRFCPCTCPEPKGLREWRYLRCKDRSMDATRVPEAMLIIAGKGQHDYPRSGHVNPWVNLLFIQSMPSWKKGQSQDDGPASTLNRHVSHSGGWRLRNEETKKRRSGRWLCIPAGQSLRIFRSVDFQEAKKCRRRQGGLIVGRIPQERATACMQVCGGLRSASPG